jgi:hypothetical protein
MITKETMTAVVHTFLDSHISEPRHRDRVRKVTKIERKYSRGV